MSAPATPEHDKISNADSEFIQRVQMLFEELESKGYALHYMATQEPVSTNSSKHLQLILEHFGVNYQKWLAEKEALLGYLRSQQKA